MVQRSSTKLAATKEVHVLVNGKDAPNYPSANGECCNRGCYRSAPGSSFAHRWWNDEPWTMCAAAVTTAASELEVNNEIKSHLVALGAVACGGKSGTILVVPVLLTSTNPIGLCVRNQTTADSAQTWPQIHQTWLVQQALVLHYQTWHHTNLQSLSPRCHQ